MAKYVVRCERDEDGWWVGRVQGVAGVLTQGRSLATIRKRIREALSLAVDDADDAELELRPKVPAVVLEGLTALRVIRKDLEREQLRAKKLEKKVARALAKAMSYRDAGEVLSLTGQRVQQLASK
jgi:predicted RNase H-like HicB family nuclease